MNFQNGTIPLGDQMIHSTMSHVCKRKDKTEALETVSTQLLKIPNLLLCYHIIF